VEPNLGGLSRQFITGTRNLWAREKESYTLKESASPHTLPGGMAA